jgi:hypothetical protein
VFGEIFYHGNTGELGTSTLLGPFFPQVKEELTVTFSKSPEGSN